MTVTLKQEITHSSSNNWKFGFISTKNTLGQFSALKDFTATVRLGPVWLVAYGGWLTLLSHFADFTVWLFTCATVTLSLHIYPVTITCARNAHCSAKVTYAHREWRKQQQGILSSLMFLGFNNKLLVSSHSFKWYSLSNNPDTSASPILLTDIVQREIFRMWNVRLGIL